MGLKHIAIFTVLVIVFYSIYQTSDKTPLSEEIASLRTETTIPPQPRSGEDYVTNVPDFYKHEDKSLTQENEKKFNTVLDNIEFPPLTKPEEYKLKSCLSQYIPRYPDYSFKAEESPTASNIVTYIPIETLQPSKNHILEKSGYYKPLEMRVGISQNTQNTLNLNFEITSFYQQKGFITRPRKYESTHNLSIKKKLTKQPMVRI